MSDSPKNVDFWECTEFDKFRWPMVGDRKDRMSKFSILTVSLRDNALCRKLSGARKKDNTLEIQRIGNI